MLLSNLTGFQALYGFPATSTVTLSDNDTEFQFSAASYSIWETGGVATITVLRGDDLNSAVTVDFATSDDGTSELDMITIKYSGTDGSMLWQKGYNGPGYGEESPKGLAVDSNGNVVVTGNSIGTNFNSDYYTAKYAAADGALF